MTNREKYAEQILDIACSGGSIAMSEETGELLDCADCGCLSCVFYYPESDECLQNLKKWANAEYSEKKPLGKETMGWIPITKRFPEPGTYILLSFANYLMASIGRYEEDENGNGNFYNNDSDEPLISYGFFVNAWMPLPEPYREVSDSENIEARR